VYHMYNGNDNGTLNAMGMETLKGKLGKGLRVMVKTTIRSRVGLQS
jgi:hypothetical protein